MHTDRRAFHRQQLNILNCVFLMRLSGAFLMQFKNRHFSEENRATRGCCTTIFPIRTAGRVAECKSASLCRLRRFQKKFEFRLYFFSAAQCVLLLALPFLSELSFVGRCDRIQNAHWAPTDAAAAADAHNGGLFAEQARRPAEIGAFLLLLTKHERLCQPWTDARPPEPRRACFCIFLKRAARD